MVRQKLNWRRTSTKTISCHDADRKKQTKQTTKQTNKNNQNKQNQNKQPHTPVLPFVSAAIPCRDDTMLSPLALISPWTGTCHASVWRFCFVLPCFVVVLVVLLLVLVFLFFACLWWLRDGLLDCAQVHYQFTLEAPQSADGHVYALIN